MSILRADSIRDRAGTGAPDFPNGLTGNVTGTATTATNAQGLTGTPNITVGTVTGTDATFSGNLTVQGTTTTIDTTVTAVDSLAVDGLVSTLGNVGIGTANTTDGTDANARQLVIRNTADPTARGGLSLIHGTSGTGGFGSIVFGSSNATRRGAIEYSHQHDSMSIETLAGEKLVIRSNGNIGLGTLSAGASDAALDIKKDNADIKLGNPGGQYHRLKSLSTGEFTINDNDTAERLRITSGGTAIFKGGLAEKFQSGTTIQADPTLALSDGNVVLRTSNESGNQAINFTGVHSTLAVGEAVSFTVIITPNGSGAINAVQIDAVGQTIQWSGGSAPSAGAAGSRDVYTFTLLKTGSGTTNYEVFGAAQNYA
jgi:hypothetical protein